MSTPTPITGDAMAKLLGRGINLGQTFESAQNQRSPARVRALLKSYKEKGFQSVRIPVTWMGSSTSTTKLTDTTFMSQLDDAINTAISLGLKLTLDSHHESWLYDSYTGAQAQNDIFWRLWRDIATRYKHIPQDQLVFQILNEPQGVFGAAKDGTDYKSQKCKDLTLLINKTGFDGVRYVDKTRVVAVTVPNMDNVWQVPALLPSPDLLPQTNGAPDKYLMVTGHSYDTFTFCGQDGSVNEYTSQLHPYDRLRADIDKRFAMLAAWKAKMPSYVGFALTECGVGRKYTPALDHGLVREYFRYTGRRSLENGFGVMVWQDNGWFELHSQPSSTGSVNYIYSLVDAFLGKV